MRKYANLKQPIRCNENDFVYKIMLYQSEKECVYLFYYCSNDAIQSKFDEYFEHIEDLYEEWNEYIDDKGWIDIEDPLPDCQHDAFIPLRVKGRDTFFHIPILPQKLLLF